MLLPSPDCPTGCRRCFGADRWRARSGEKKGSSDPVLSVDPGAGLVCHRIGYPHIADDHFKRSLNWKGRSPEEGCDDPRQILD
jgi:hypothetical protein